MKPISRAEKSLVGATLLALALPLGVLSWQYFRERFTPHVIEAHTERAMSVAFSPDSSLLVSAGGSLKAGAEIRVWDVKTRALQASFKGSGAQVRAFDARFSPDGTRILAAKGDGVAEQRYWPSQAWLNAMNQKGLIPISVMKQIKGTTPQRGLWIPWFPGNLGRLMSVDYSPDGRFIATCGWMSSAKALWSSADGRLVREFASPLANLSQVSFAPDGHRFLTIDAILADASPRSNASPRTAATATGQGLIRLWETKKPRQGTALPITLPVQEALYAAWSPNGQSLAVTLKTGVQLFNIQTKPPFATPSHILYSGPGSSSLAWSPDGRMLAVRSPDAVLIYRVSTGALVRRLTIAASKAEEIRLVSHTLAWSPNRNWISVAHNQQVLLWNTEAMALSQ